MVILVQQPKVLGQLLWRAEIAGIDIRIARGVGSIVRLTVDDGNDAILQRRVQFIRNVVGAQGILKGQHELVIFSKHLHAL